MFSSNLWDIHSFNKFVSVRYNLLAQSLEASVPGRNDGRTGVQPLVPRPRVRVLGLPLLVETLTVDVRREGDEPEPRHEGQVGVGQLVAAEVLLVGLLEVRVDDADDARDLVAVALVDAGDVLV